MSNTINRAIVTGASSGIGAAIAKGLCIHDVEVMAVARNRTKLEKVKRSLPEVNRPNFKVIVADIQKAEGISKILKLSQPLDTLDVLVNNAGIGVFKPLEEHTAAEVNGVVSTNLFGTIMLTKGVLSGREKNKLLRIVFVTSLAGKIGFPDLSVYSASKFAVEGFAESLRSEYRREHVKVSVLRPGVTDTNFFNVAGMKEYRDGAQPMHSPSLVAEALLKNIDKPEIVIGSDKYFIKLLPFTPFNKRFRLLAFTNRLERRR